ncbi:tetratricopeptide repeat protein [Actinoplanes sp. NPDC023936]|uniref:tetratricopeptide repeat protein n=1 Tax=Actinoplanes sp. NPDC023936 TaxID=3154910 RepID=UPI00340057A1
MTAASRARALAGVGRLSDAEAEVRAGLARLPTDPELLALLAGLLRLQGRRAEALAAADAAVAAAPHLSGTHIERAECLLMIPSGTEESSETSPASTASPASGPSTAESDETRTAEALREAREAVRLDPAHPPAYRVLARVLSSRREFDQAREAARRALALDPHSVIDLLTLGEIERHAGRRGAARAAVGAALAEDPGNPDGRWLIALLDAERLRVRSSLRGLRELAADHPDKLDVTALTWPVRGLLGGFRRGLGVGVPLVVLLAGCALLWPSWELAARAAAATVTLVMIGFGLRVLVPAGLLPWRCLALLPVRTRRAVRAGWVAAGATVALLLGYGVTALALLPVLALVTLAVLLVTGRADRM